MVGPDTFLSAQSAATAWTVAQLDSYRDALRLPTTPLAPMHGPALADALANRNAKRDAAPWPAFRSQLELSPSILARRAQQQQQRRMAAARAQYRSDFRAYFGRRPLAPATDAYRYTMPAALPGTVTNADALHMALSTIGAAPEERTQRVTLNYPDRSVTNPARMTVGTVPVIAHPGAVPRPLDPAAIGPQLVAQPGETLWLNAGRWTDEHGPDGGEVTRRISLDIDGKPAPRGGRGKQAQRPSTVPPGALRTPTEVTTTNGPARLWLWTDKDGTIEARTMSGHDAHLTPRALAAVRRRYFTEKGTTL
jgi:hypothetical protein